MWGQTLWRCDGSACQLGFLGFLRPGGRPFYGIDAPRELGFLGCLASFFFIIVFALTILPRTHEKLKKTLTESRRYNKLYYDLLRPLFIVGFLYFGGCCAHYVYSSLELKYSVADRMVSMVNWSQTRSVLDVGCGQGLLMNTFALALKNVSFSLARCMFSTRVAPNSAQFWVIVLSSFTRFCLLRRKHSCSCDSMG